MGRKIDQRASLQNTSGAAARQGDAPSARGEDAGLKLSIREAKAAGDHSHKAAAQTAAAEAAAEEATDVRSTFELPGRDWGLGFGNLSAVQDSETAFLIMGDGSISIVESVGTSYMFRSGFPTEGYFVSHILEGAGLFAGTNADLLHSFSDRKDVVLNSGQTNFSVRGEAVDLIGTGAAESVTASAGDDILHGAGGNDNLIGAGGQDIVWGGAGNDAVAGNDGNDFLGGNAGNDTVDGGEGKDFLTGGGGADSMLGGEGDDVVMGGDGADTVEGGAGVDTLIAGLGADSVLGGDGADIFVFTQGDSGAAVNQLDTVGDFELGVDFIDLTGFDKAISFVDAFSDKAFQATITKVEPAEDSEDPVKWSVKIDTDGDGTADQEITVLFDKDSAEGDLTTDSFIV